MRSYFPSNSTSEEEMLAEEFRDRLDESVDLFLPQNAELDERIRHYTIKKQIAEQHGARLKKKTEECDVKQHKFEMYTCMYAEAIFDMCKTYDHTYSVAVSLYEKDVAIVKVKENDRKVE